MIFYFCLSYNYYVQQPDFSLGVDAKVSKQRGGAGSSNNSWKFLQKRPVWRSPVLCRQEGALKSPGLLAPKGWAPPTQDPANPVDLERTCPAPSSGIDPRTAVNSQILKASVIEFEKVELRVVKMQTPTVN